MLQRLFHPVLFYPVVLGLAAAIVLFGLEPQKWPRPPAPVTAAPADGALVLQGDAFNAPAPGPGQNIMVARDFFGRPQALRIGVLPQQPLPTRADRGVRILLAPQTAAQLERRAATIEVSYKPLPFNAASGLAVSVQGQGETRWVSQPLAPEAGRVRFLAPAQTGVNAIGFRAIMPGNIDKAYGVEITRVRVVTATEALR